MHACGNRVAAARLALSGWRCDAGARLSLQRWPPMPERRQGTGLAGRGDVAGMSPGAQRRT
jgi:hypothetical protein